MSSSRTVSRLLFAPARFGAIPPLLISSRCLNRGDAGEEDSQQLPVPVGVGLLKQAFDVGPGGVERDLELLGRFFDAFTPHQLRGQSGLGWSETIEAAEDLRARLWLSLRVADEDRSGRGQVTEDRMLGTQRRDDKRVRPAQRAT